MDSSNRRQVSLPAQAQNPLSGRNPMATHGGSVNVRGSQVQGDRGPGSGLQRQQPLSSSVRAPLNRTDTPAVAVGHGPRKENRVLPIGGPVHISHRRSVVAAEAPQERERPNSHNASAPNRSSLLKRQAEIDEEMVGGGSSSGDMPHQFYTHDHSNRSEVPRRSSKGQLATVAGQAQQQHRHSGSHEPLGPRNSGDSHHGSSSSGHGHTQHNAHAHAARQQPPHIFVHQDSNRGASKKQKERERQHMEDEMLRRAREKQIQLIKREIRKEKRVMLTFSLISSFFGILWLIAVCISYWYFVYADEESLAAVVKAYSTQMPPPAVRSGTGHGIGELIKGAMNATAAAKGPPTRKPTTRPAIVIDANDLFVSSHVGLWRVCRTKRYLQTGNEKILCYWHDMFPSEEKLRVVQYTDRHIVDYQRTEASFAVISLMVMAMVVPAALYTLKNTKYIFKRLAAGLYFLSSVTVLVVLEVTLTKIDHESTKPYLRPPKSTVSYGFCFYVGWLVFSMNLITAIVYLVYSRKRKGDKALDDDDEEQEIIGR